MTDLRKAAEQALEALEIATTYLPVKTATLNEVEKAMQALRQALAQPEAEIERLKKEVEHLRQAYHRVKDENERLSLDLGIKNKDFR